MQKPVFFLMIGAVAAGGGAAMLMLRPILRSAFDEAPASAL
jgi:hypothetical protein